mgnify:CR=1 FL=1
MQTPVLTWGGRHNLHNGEYREAFTRDAPPERHNPGRILWGEDMSGIKEAYTTQELMIILGVRDASTVLRRVKREGWLSRSCSGRGGGFEWLVSSMPEKTRLAIAYAVIYYMALYDIFRSLDPNNCVLFLVLSIVFSVTEPFFLFFNRNKDGGMPPRRPEPVCMPPEPDWCDNSQDTGNTDFL